MHILILFLSIFVFTSNGFAADVKRFSSPIDSRNFEAELEARKAALASLIGSGYQIDKYIIETSEGIYDSGKFTDIGVKVTFQSGAANWTCHQVIAVKKTASMGWSPFPIRSPKCESGIK